MLVVISSILILAPLEGTNFGSTVIICLPLDVCGISSKHLFLSFSSSTFGTTKVSITFLINELLPVLTAPTTPRYISPLPFLEMLSSISFLSIFFTPFIFT